MFLAFASSDFEKAISREKRDKLTSMPLLVFWT